MSQLKFRPQYHKGTNANGLKSVALDPKSYHRLREKADELEVTIKSLLTVLIDKYIDEVSREE